MTEAQIAARKMWMGLVARAPIARLASLMPDIADHQMLRRPEVGTVMVRGRVGATGAPFNLGEMTVTRCTLQLATGEVGHSNVQGRDRDHALRAALVDAQMQGPLADVTRRLVLDPLAAEEAQRRASRAAQAAATKVDFFTLVRGEDQ